MPQQIHRGIKAMIPFKNNAKADGQRSGKSEVWARLFHFFSLQREAFLAAYHTRSNVESTFSSMKRKFGDQIRSKNADGSSQRNAGQGALPQPVLPHSGNE